MTKANLQRDGCTLVQASVVRYSESVMTVVRSIFESHPSPQKKLDNPDAHEEESKEQDNGGVEVYSKIWN